MSTKLDNIKSSEKLMIIIPKSLKNGVKQKGIIINQKKYQNNT